MDVFCHNTNGAWSWLGGTGTKPGTGSRDFLGIPSSREFLYGLCFLTEIQHSARYRGKSSGARTRPRMIPTDDASARKREIEEKLKQVGSGDVERWTGRVIGSRTGRPGDRMGRLQTGPSELDYAVVTGRRSTEPSAYLQTRHSTLLCDIC